MSGGSNNVGCDNDTSGMSDHAIIFPGLVRMGCDVRHGPCSRVATSTVYVRKAKAWADPSQCCRWIASDARLS
jgi:hypothetical protein